MPEGTIKEVTGQREWTGNFGTMIDYELTIESGGQTGQVYMTKKPDSPAPAPGDSFDYEVVKRDKFGTKIKRVFDTPYTATNGSSLKAGPSQAARNESIERQVAAKCAAEVAVGYLTSDKLAVVDAPLIAELTDAFHQAIRGYKVEADPANNTAQDSLPKPDTDGLPAGDDDSIPF